jgi:hypothetical protein
MLGDMAGPHPHVDTAAQRPATGLDKGARQLMLHVVAEIGDQRRSSVPTPEFVIWRYFHNRYGSWADYMDAVEAVWGDAIRFQLVQETESARAEAEFGPVISTRAGARGQTAASLVLLLGMPEPDFRMAIEVTLRYLQALEDFAERISEICRNRGIPWRLDPKTGFEWTGDDVIEQEVLAPALTILNDSRLASGAGKEFAQARAELKLGTPEARKQVLVEAACAVESTMKVLLQQRNVSFEPRDTAQKLFEHLRDNAIIVSDTERLILACATPRNKRAGHGAGAVAHEVQQHEAEAFVAAAATAIAFLGKLLP